MVIMEKDFLNKHQTLSSRIPFELTVYDRNKFNSTFTVKQTERSLSSLYSQLIPDSIINDKQTQKRIVNEEKSTHSMHIQSTPYNLPLNYVHHYKIIPILTATSKYFAHQNQIHAHLPPPESFLSDTIFIILIAILAIIILLFCIGLYCLCRHATRRNLSPSFDSSSFIGLNGHSVEIPIGDYQQRFIEYENDIPHIRNLSSSIETRSPINQSLLVNDKIFQPQTVTMHYTNKRKTHMNKQNLKRKKPGLCCCNTK